MTPITNAQLLAGGSRVDFTETGSRMDLRKPADLAVLVFRDGAFVARGKARNVSLKGLYLEADLIAPVGTRLEVALMFGDPGQHRPRRIQVRVAHASSRGVGLRFLEFNRAVFRELKPIVFG